MQILWHKARKRWTQYVALSHLWTKLRKRTVHETKKYKVQLVQVGVSAVGMRSGAGCLGYGGVRLPFAKYMLKLHY